MGARAATLEELLRAHGPELRRHAARLLRDAGADPDDVVQEVALRAFRRHGHGPVELDEPRAWLHACVRNACLDRLRAARPAAPVDPDAVLAAAPGAGEPHEQLARRAEVATVLSDLAALDVRQRVALAATTLDDRSYAGVADDLGASEATVRALVARARENLRALRRAREAPCADVRGLLDGARSRGVRPPELVRRHLAGCAGCSAYAGTTRRRPARRVAGLLAPLHGLLAHLGQRAAEVALPAVATDVGATHAAAVLAAVAGAAAALPTATPEERPAHHEARRAPLAQVAPPTTRAAAVAVRPRAVAIAPTTTAPPRRASTRTAVAPAPRATTTSPARTTTSTTPATAPTAAPGQTNLFGCAKVTGRMTAADAACRREHAAEVRAQIDARLARAPRTTATVPVTPATATAVRSPPPPTYVPAPG